MRSRLPLTAMNADDAMTARSVRLAEGQRPHDLPAGRHGDMLGFTVGGSLRSRKAETGRWAGANLGAVRKASG